MTEYEKELLEVKKNENALKAIELIYNREIGDHYLYMLKSIANEGCYAPYDRNLPEKEIDFD